jgi:hypothetical protein
MSFFVLYPDERLVVSLQSNLLFGPFNVFAAEAFAVAESFLAGEIADAPTNNSSAATRSASETLATGAFAR